MSNSILTNLETNCWYHQKHLVTCTSKTIFSLRYPDTFQYEPRIQKTLKCCLLRTTSYVEKQCFAKFPASRETTIKVITDCSWYEYGLNCNLKCSWKEVLPIPRTVGTLRLKLGAHISSRGTKAACTRTTTDPKMFKTLPLS